MIGLSVGFGGPRGNEPMGLDIRLCGLHRSIVPVSRLRNDAGGLTIAPGHYLSSNEF